MGKINLRNQIQDTVEEVVVVRNDSYVIINGITRVSTSSADDISADLTTSTSTAGRGGVAIPLQISSDTDTEGVITSGTNTVLLRDATDEKVVTDLVGNEVFGKITEAVGVYTLTYYTKVSGSDVVYSLPAGDIDIMYPYRFSFNLSPVEGVTIIKTEFTNIDPSDITQVDGGDA